MRQRFRSSRHAAVDRGGDDDEPADLTDELHWERVPNMIRHLTITSVRAPRPGRAGHQPTQIRLRHVLTERQMTMSTLEYYLRQRPTIVQDRLRSDDNIRIGRRLDDAFDDVDAAQLHNGPGDIGVA